MARYDRGLTQDASATCIRTQRDLGEARRGGSDAINGSQVRVDEGLIAIEQGAHIGTGREHDILDEKLRRLQHRVAYSGGEGWERRLIFIDQQDDIGPGQLAEE